MTRTRRFRRAVRRALIPTPRVRGRVRGFTRSAVVLMFNTLGLAGVVYAGWLISQPLGFALAGVAAFTVVWALDTGGDS